MVLRLSYIICYTVAMALTREQAERICEEARFQGWVREGEALLEAGRAEMRQWYTSESPPQPMGLYAVDLKFPVMLGPEYTVKSTDDWRRLKAKYDEIKQIIEEASERGWEVDSRLHKQGKFGMSIEVYPPGTRRPYGKRVGGMRTWRKLIREADDIIDGEVIE